MKFPNEQPLRQMSKGRDAVSHRPLRRSEAATYVQQTYGIPLSPRTLAKYAVVGGGPTYRKARRYPLYELEDLDAWALAKLGPKQRSTSEIPEVA